MYTEILSASCRHEYLEKQILQHKKRFMTDNTSHTLNIINQVVEKLRVESVPTAMM